MNARRDVLMSSRVMVASAELFGPSLDEVVRIKAEVTQRLRDLARHLSATSEQLATD